MTLALWLDPADDAQVTTGGTGSTVDSVADKSVDGNDVSLTGVGPGQTLNNLLKTLDFTVGNNPLRRVNASLTNMDGPDLTAIVCVTDDGTTSVGGQFQHIFGNTSNGLDDGWRFSKLQSSVNITGSIENWNANTVAVHNGDTLGEMIILVLEFSATLDQIIVYKDGVEVGTVADANALDLTNDLMIGATTLDGGDWWSDGLIGDCIYFDGILTSDERQRAEGYLAHKWDIAANLPAAHPFRYGTPDINYAAEALVLFEGVDGDTTYTTDDAVGRTVTFLGTAAISELASQFGGTALLLDGNSDSVTIPDHADFELTTTADFTLEFWIRPNAAIVTAGKNVINKGGVSGSVWPNYTVSVNTNDTVSFGIFANGSQLINLASTDVLVIDTWHHVAVTWDFASDTAELFVDGVSQATGVSAGAIYSTNTGPLQIGHQASSANDYFPGYIDGLRVTPGKRLYANNFNVPHRAFRLPVAAELICNFNGADAATSYTSEDAAARTATFVGNAQLDTAQKKFSKSSLLCDGTGDWLTFPTHADFDFGAGDLTIDLWMRPADITDVNIIGWGNTVAGAIYINASNKLVFYSSAVNQIIGGTTIVVNTWNHVRLVRSGTIFYLYLNGVLEGDAEPATQTYDQAVLYIGGTGGANPFNGHIDGVRILKGTNLRAIIAQDFPFNSTRNTSDLLINFDGVDAATAYVTDDVVERTVTFLSTAQLDSAERRRGETSLRTGLTTTAGVTIPSAADLALGTTDFTIEFHIMPNSITGTQLIWDQRNAGTSVFPAIYMLSNTMRLYVNGADRIISSTIMTIGAWFHIVVERTAGVTRMYIDGVQEGADYTDANNYGQNILGLGDATYVTGNSFDGWLDGIRQNSNEAIYNGDFGVPIASAAEPIL